MQSTTISILIAGILIGGAIVFTRSSKNSPDGGGQEVPPVAVVDGKQIVTIVAKGGYAPRVSNAQADMPTVLRVETRGTFDCSAALSIPAIEYRAMLPPSDTTDIEVPPQKSGTTLQAMCAMGMYGFSVAFN